MSLSPCKSPNCIPLTYSVGSDWRARAIDLGMRIWRNSGRLILTASYAEYAFVVAISSAVSTSRSPWAEEDCEDGPHPIATNATNIVTSTERKGNCLFMSRFAFVLSPRCIRSHSVDQLQIFDQTIQVLRVFAHSTPFVRSAQQMVRFVFVFDGNR